MKTSAQPSYLQRSPEIWVLLILLGLPQFSENIYSPALPAISQGLQATHAFVQWTLSVYSVGFAIGVLIWGRLSDQLGQKKSMLLGLLTYCVGTILCIFSKNIEWLLLSRVVQGFGGSACSVVGQAIARGSLEQHKRHQFFSMSGFVLAFSITLGPFVCGYLTQWFNWQSNFVFLTILGISVLAIVFTRLPGINKKGDTKKPSAALLSVAKRLLQDRRVIYYACLIGIAQGILFSYYAEAPFIYIKLLKLTPSQFGKLGLFIALAAFLGSIFSRKLASHIPQKTVILIGGLIALFSSLLLLALAFFGFISHTHILISIIAITLPMMGIVFAAYGFISPIALGTALLNYSTVLGTAGALFGLSYYFMVSILTWLMGLFNNGTVYPMPIYFFVLSCVSLFIILKLRKLN